MNAQVLATEIMLLVRELHEQEMKKEAFQVWALLRFALKIHSDYETLLEEGKGEAYLFGLN